jgi:hypothetical protein
MLRHDFFQCSMDSPAISRARVAFREQTVGAEKTTLAVNAASDSKSMCAIDFFEALACERISAQVLL